ncbi:S1C family serine protease [Nocardiopsis sp. NPDC006938]|uniref:S1C family serine protease n=1 Tax=Nocardiopsis sp. NPDC006938 TaxID=3364337 RepID=UPI00368A760F
MHPHQPPHGDRPQAGGTEDPQQPLQPQQASGAQRPHDGQALGQPQSHEYPQAPVSQQSQGAQQPHEGQQERAAQQARAAQQGQAGQQTPASFGAQQNQQSTGAQQAHGAQQPQSHAAQQAQTSQQSLAAQQAHASQQAHNAQWLQPNASQQAQATQQAYTAQQAYARQTQQNPFAQSSQGAATHGHFAAPPGATASHPPTAPEQPPRRGKRGVPLWAALSGMLVIGLIAGGAGGLAGGLLGPDQQAAPENKTGPTINEPPPEAPERAADTIAGVAQRVSPSVVSLRSAGGRVGATGSGFVIADDYVVTNDHVSAPLEEDGIVIEYSDGSNSLATVVGSDPSSDLAVLELEDPNEVEPLEFGDSDEAVVGDEVIAIGAPLGLDGTVTQGIISAKDRPVSSDEGESQFFALQTDAAINPGNSGGPLVDVQGRVIGVNSMIVTMGGGFMGEQPGGSIGLGFAIPSTEAEEVVNRMIDHGETSYADLGVVFDSRNPVIGAAIDDDPQAVERGGPADEAGLEPGDVIVSFDGRRVNSAGELQAMVRDRSPGEEVELEYERDGDREAVTVTLGASD